MDGAAAWKGLMGRMQKRELVPIPSVSESSSQDVCFFSVVFGIGMGRRFMFLFNVFFYIGMEGSHMFLSCGMEESIASK